MFVFEKRPDRRQGGILFAYFWLKFLLTKKKHMKKLLLAAVVFLSMTGFAMAQTHHPVHHRKHHKPVHHRPVHRQDHHE
jgi:hypothetical protein